MDRAYLVHWVVGVVAAVVWFWGDRMGIPAAAVTLASTLVPTIIGHALGYTPGTPVQEQVPTAPTQGGAA